MRNVEITKTQFRIADFVSWQRQGTLVLSPAFQRRPVWKPDAKSYFMDTVMRGLPAPIIYIRERIKLETQETEREVVDGQQRLRTVISFIDPSLLKDFDDEHDTFTVKKYHNEEAAGKSFDDLPKELREQILSYQFSTHILPINMDDRDVLQMFARLNATGVRLNQQELRNATYFGEFKTAMYELGLEQLDRWREWRVFSHNQIARMAEVEMTSDLVMNIMKGLTGKTQRRLDAIYKEYDQSFESAEEVKRRFRHMMESIERLLGGRLRSTVFRSKVYFFSLFVFLYDRFYELGSNLDRRKPEAPDAGLTDRLLEVSERVRSERVSPEFLDAVQRASADLGRRETRLRYFKAICDGQAGE